ncbi:MAG: hypothetical protein QXP81_09085 [Nitrososphaerota archaeon]
MGLALTRGTSCAVALTVLVNSLGPIPVEGGGLVVDLRRVVAQAGAASSWGEAVKRMSVLPVLAAAFRAPVVDDVMSLVAAVAARGAAVMAGEVLGPEQVLQMMWDELSSCGAPASRYAVWAPRLSPYSHPLRAAQLLASYPAVLCGEDGAATPASLALSLLRACQLYPGEPSALLRDHTAPAPRLDPGATVADALRVVARLGVAVLPGDRVLTASELLSALLRERTTLRLDRFFV